MGPGMLERGKGESNVVLRKEEAEAGEYPKSQTGVRVLVEGFGFSGCDRDLPGFGFLKPRGWAIRPGFLLPSRLFWSISMCPPVCGTLSVVLGYGCENL